MIALELTYRPFAPGWLIAVGAVVLVALCLFFVVRRPLERTAWLLRILMVAALVGILVRPGYGTVPAKAKTSDLEILVVVDRTTSMSALDWNGSEPRLNGVQADLKELTEEFPGARFSLVTFGAFVRTELPYSSDSQAFLAAAEVMTVEGAFDGEGSLVDMPLEVMTESLAGAKKRHPERKRLVVFATDGENTRDGVEQRSFDDIDDLVDGGIVLGYGTESGGKMPVDPEADIDSYIYDDATQQDALSKLDEPNLTKIAGEMGATYQHREAVGGLDKWADDVDQSFSNEDDEFATKNEVYWMFALGLFVLALIELALAWRGFHAARRELKQL
ncbi:vWA domain-containing protein [Nocardioides sp. Root140]|uniref:vWA domain-containing protein n=1 Tax=Nocardioides sp. Root140 TaxID=1736460 RepID=UPI0006F310B1|nr:VWA domain-containing protein [Nocardioides sp. Root140]KQY63842.1 hypothetical protein ASD30_02335 [Nocardioides sp. Root140]